MHKADLFSKTSSSQIYFNRAPVLRETDINAAANLHFFICTKNHEIKKSCCFPSTLLLSTTFVLSYCTKSRCNTLTSEVSTTQKGEKKGEKKNDINTSDQPLSLFTYNPMPLCLSGGRLGWTRGQGVKERPAGLWEGDDEVSRPQKLCCLFVSLRGVFVCYCVCPSGGSTGVPECYPGWESGQVAYVHWGWGLLHGSPSGHCGASSFFWYLPVLITTLLCTLARSNKHPRLAAVGLAPRLLEESELNAPLLSPTSTPSVALPNLKTQSINIHDFPPPPNTPQSEHIPFSAKVQQDTRGHITIVDAFVVIVFACLD